MKYFLMLTLMLSGAAHAGPRGIDLGQIEVEGELRRPQTEWIDSQKRLMEMIPEIHKRAFLQLEQELLKPLTLAQAKKRIEVRQASRAQKKKERT